MEIIDNYKYECGAIGEKESGTVVISDVNLDSRGLRAVEHQRSDQTFFWDVPIERKDIVSSFDGLHPDAYGFRDSGDGEYSENVRALYEEWELEDRVEYTWLQAAIRYEVFSHLLEVRAPCVARTLGMIAERQRHQALDITEADFSGDTVPLAVDRVRIDKALAHLLRIFGQEGCERDLMRVSDKQYRQAMAQSIEEVADSLSPEAAQEYVDALASLTEGIFHGEKEPDNYTPELLFPLMECLKDQDKVVDMTEIVKHLSLDSFTLESRKKRD